MKELLPSDFIVGNFKRLCLELACRDDNSHTPSGLGGNPTEFWFMVNHHFKLYEGDKPSFEMTGPSQITACMPGAEVSSLEVRKVFSAFVDSQPNKVEISKEQIVDPSFLKTLPITHVDATIFIKALEVAIDLVSWLDHKIAFKKDIGKFFKKETDVLRESFLKEVGLPLDSFDEKPREEHDFKDHLAYSDSVATMFKNHPVWGAKKTAADLRKSAMIDNLLSKEDNDKMAYIAACPVPIVLQTIRSIISIERIVTLELDENPSWEKALSNANKSLNF